jgi:hypothetical protein
MAIVRGLQGDDRNAPKFQEILVQAGIADFRTRERRITLEFAGSIVGEP